VGSIPTSGTNPSLRSALVHLIFIAALLILVMWTSMPRLSARNVRSAKIGRFPVRQT
jgi:hypothetical protein